MHSVNAVTFIKDFLNTNKRHNNSILPGAKEDDEGRTEIDVLVSERDQHTPSGTAQLAIQHRVKDGVVVLYILLY